MKNLIYIILALITIKAASAQTHISSGIISGTWQKTNSPYYIDGHVNIPKDSSLQIEAGVKVIFGDSIRMIVNGSIQAIGEKTDSISFDIADTTGFSDTSIYAGGWGGIRFFDADSNSIALFQYCNFSHGKTKSKNDTLGNGGVVFVSAYPNIQFHNCDFDNNISMMNGGAIYYTDLCNILIDSCSITHNYSFSSGGGIATQRHANSMISNSKILYNKSYMSNGGGFSVRIDDLVIDHEPILLNNYICNNSSNFGGGIYESSYESYFIGNIICNNSGYGAVIGHSLSQSRYINNTICNNGYFNSAHYNMGYFEAGGILSYSLNIKVINNIIRNNFAIGSTWYDTANIVYGFTYSTLNLYYVDKNNIEYGYSGIDNIDKDPYFVNPSSGIGINHDGYSADWSLSDSSGSINAGTNDTTYFSLPPFDIYSNPRIYGDAIDQGAVENQNIVQSIAVLNKPKMAVKIYPNPAKDILYLKIENTADNYDYSIFNSVGNIIEKGSLFSGTNQIIVNNLSSGVYYINIVNGDYQKIIKFIKE